MALPAWQSNIDYKKYDIIEEPSGSNIYYYSILDHTSGASGSSGSSGLSGTFYSNKTRWAGILEINGKKIPHFFWKPDGNTKYSIKAENQITRFGDGYEQRSKANIDNIVLSLQLSFSKRTYKEIVSILHFLNQRRGYEQFIYIPPCIYTTYSYNFPKQFVCKSWQHTTVFKENHTVTATFEEVPVERKFSIIR